jgi:hypothetical protein
MHHRTRVRTPPLALRPTRLANQLPTPRQPRMARRRHQLAPHRHPPRRLATPSPRRPPLAPIRVHRHRPAHPARRPARPVPHRRTHSRRSPARSRGEAVAEGVRAGGRADHPAFGGGDGRGGSPRARGSCRRPGDALTCGPAGLSVAGRSVDSAHPGRQAVDPGICAQAAAGPTHGFRPPLHSAVARSRLRVRRRASAMAPRGPDIVVNRSVPATVALAGPTPGTVL